MEISDSKEKNFRFAKLEIAFNIIMKVVFLYNRISCSEIMFLCSFIPGGSLGSSSSASRTWNWHIDPGDHLSFRLTAIILRILFYFELNCLLYVWHNMIQDLPGIQASYSLLVFTWLSMRLLHLWLRFRSLSVLKFQTVRLFDNCIISNFFEV